MGYVMNNPAGPLLSATAQVTGNGMDCRAAADFGFLFYHCTGNSAIFDVQASPDGVNWIPFATYTATNGGSATAHVSAFLPYVRAVARSIYSAAGGSARLYAWYQPGLS